MNGNNGFAVFLFPQALEALGEAIKPYLQDGPAGPHVVCNGIDTAGSLIEMSLSATSTDGRALELEVMVPSGMVRMIVSAHSDEMFGFGPHEMRNPVTEAPAVAGGPDATIHAPAPADEKPAKKAAEKKAAKSAKKAESKKAAKAKPKKKVSKKKSGKKAK